MNSGWLVPIIFFGLCVLSLLWSSATAPGLNVRDKHVLISGTQVHLTRAELSCNERQLTN